jgi:glutaredoxin
MDKMKKAAQGNVLDLTSDEDLSIGIMNLISIEEHLFYTANKTGKDRYYGLLNEVREMRKELLKKIVVSFEGEVWCISKHLLAASMRLMEVGTKELKIGGIVCAEPYFEKSYRLFRMFWEITLQQPQQNDAPPTNAGSPKKEVQFFYDAKCPHCKILESFLTRNGLYEVFNIVRKEVTSNSANHAEMVKIYKNYLKSSGEMVAPMVYQNGNGAMGEEACMRLFKSLMWDYVKELKQTLGALMKQGSMPAHIQTHLENYNKTVDAALNCCKE